MTARESDGFYEWLLSDNPDARAERDRRREATYHDERERSGKVLAWVAKIRAAPDAAETVRELAETMGPLAAKSATRAETAFAEPDEVFVARARESHETYMRVSSPDGSWGYSYPERYVGEAATSEPRPEAEPSAEASRDEPEIGS